MEAGRRQPMDAIVHTTKEDALLRKHVQTVADKRVCGFLKVALSDAKNAQVRTVNQRCS